MSDLIESGRMFTEVRILKYRAEDIPEGQPIKSVEPYEITDAGQPGNLLVNGGINRIWGQLNSNTQVWDQTHTGIGVGNSSTAAAASDNNLLGASKRFNQCDSGFPSLPGVQNIQFAATFGTADANFAWNEYGIVVPNTSTTFTAGGTLPTNYVLLNRKVVSLGTKTSSDIWIFTATMTLA